MNAEHTHLGNTLFLLSLAPLSVGCIIATDDSDTEVSSGSSGAAGSTGGAETGATTGGGTETGGESGSGTASGNGDSGTGDETAGSDGGTTGEPSPICVAYGSLIDTCNMNDMYGQDATMYCEQVLDEYYSIGGAECQTAFEEYVACLNSLDCQTFLGRDPFCQAEDAAIGKACPKR